MFPFLSLLHDTFHGYFSFIALYPCINSCHEIIICKNAIIEMVDILLSFRIFWEGERQTMRGGCPRPRSAGGWTRSWWGPSSCSWWAPPLSPPPAPPRPQCHPAPGGQYKAEMKWGLLVKSWTEQDVLQRSDKVVYVYLEILPSEPQPGEHPQPRYGHLIILAPAQTHPCHHRVTNLTRIFHNTRIYRSAFIMFTIHPFTRYIRHWPWQWHCLCCV